jgi:hypothetical protein
VSCVSKLGCSHGPDAARGKRKKANSTRKKRRFSVRHRANCPFLESLHRNGRGSACLVGRGRVGRPACTGAAHLMRAIRCFRLRLSLLEGETRFTRASCRSSMEYRGFCWTRCLVRDSTTHFCLEAKGFKEFFARKVVGD